MNQPAHDPISVLVVEDDELVRGLAVEMLSEAGFEVLEAPNGGKALSLVEGGARVDVLFTDVNMPGEPDGIGLAEAVCARRPQVRVLVASGRPLPVRVLPCDGRFLPKPYQLTDLGRVIHDLAK